MRALFAVVFVLLYRRYGDRVSPRAMALGIAAAALLAIYFVPFLKYPANPPAIGLPATIHARRDLYLGMVGVSIVSVIGAFFRQVPRRAMGRLERHDRDRDRVHRLDRDLTAISPPLGQLHSKVVVYGKQITETPLPIYGTHGQLIYPGFPADVVFKFRPYSVLNQILLWGTIGLSFGLLAERALAGAKTADTGSWAIPQAAEPAV